METCSVRPADIEKKWVTVDATGHSLGRLASEIARVLRGKHKANFVPHLDCGDNVIVTNVEKIVLTGNKWKDKVYYSHSGYIGGIKGVRAEEMLANHPDRLLTYAVRGMLPKNKLSRALMKNLRVYAGAEHPHSAQNVETMAPRLAN